MTRVRATRSQPADRLLVFPALAAPPRVDLADPRWADPADLRPVAPVGPLRVGLVGLQPADLVRLARLLVDLVGRPPCLVPPVLPAAQ